jgi:ABC-type branched-subunit amino acid transport system substrate-binding protein
MSASSAGSGRLTRTGNAPPLYSLRHRGGIPVRTRREEVGARVTEHGVSADPAIRRFRPGTSLSHTAIGRRSFLLGCIAGGLPACARSPETTDAVRLGVLLPFTGRSGGPSHNFERAVLFARAQLDTTGLGGIPLEVVFGDTHSELARGLVAADALVAKGVVAILGPESDELAQALLERLYARGVLLISPGISSEPAEAGRDVWFRVAPSTRAMAENLAKRAYDLNVERVLVLETADHYNASFAAAFKQRFAQLGKTVTARTLPDDRQSYGDLLPDIQGSKHVLLAARAETAARVVNEMAGLTSLPRWYLTPALRTDVFVRNASPRALSGAIGVTPDLSIDAGFAAAFQSYSRGDPPLESALFYFDAAALFALGYERALAKSQTVPGASELAEGMFAAAFNSGVVTGWSELSAAVKEVRAGVTRYYRGLTGSMVLGRDGQRSLGREKLWTVSDQGEIIDMK